MAPWERGSSVQDPGDAPWAWWRCLLIDSFPCLEDRFLTFCANWPSCTDHFLHPFWNGLEGFGRLGGFWSPLTVHSCFLASFLVLTLYGIISRKYNKDVCLGKMLPYFLMALSPVTLFSVLSHTVLLPTILYQLHSQGLQGCCAGFRASCCPGDPPGAGSGVQCWGTGMSCAEPQATFGRGRDIACGICRWGLALQTLKHLPIPCQQAVLPAGGPSERLHFP